MAGFEDAKLPERAAWEDWAALAARLFLAGLFIYSSWHKIQDPIAFQIKVNEYEILPAAWEATFARVAPWVMMVSAELLVLGLLTRAGAGALLLLLVSFMVAIGVNVYRDRVLGCGCFSEEGHQVGWLLVVQDLALFLVAGWLAWRGGGRWSVDHVAGRFLPRRRGERGEELTEKKE
ncbi:MAG TPA: MauE/DoxX family redox-associated membrane protein [bacterium]|nr:MauE/DoxX family redox-associated membrane protein [bacterium]